MSKPSCWHMPTMMSGSPCCSLVPVQTMKILGEAKPSSCTSVVFLPFIPHVLACNMKCECLMSAEDVCHGAAERTSFQKKFRDWLISCHANLDKRIHYSKMADAALQVGPLLHTAHSLICRELARALLSLLCTCRHVG